MNKPRLPRYRGQKINNRDWIEGMPVKRKDRWFIETETIDEDGNHTYRATDILPDSLGEYAGKLGANAIEVWEGDVIIASLNHHGKPTGIEFKAHIHWNEHVGTWQIMYEGAGGRMVTDDIGFRYFLTATGETIHDKRHQTKKNEKK